MIDCEAILPEVTLVLYMETWLAVGIKIPPKWLIHVATPYLLNNATFNGGVCVWFLGTEQKVFPNRFLSNLIPESLSVERVVEL